MLAHDQPWKDNNINETIYWCSNDLWCNQTHSKEFANDRILLWSFYLFILLSIYFFYHSQRVLCHIFEHESLEQIQIECDTLLIDNLLMKCLNWWNEKLV